MNEIYPKFNLTLKTGFFKTEAFILLVQENVLRLIPEKDKKNTCDDLIINYSSIKTVSISSEIPVEIEIRTDEATFIGTFSKSADMEGMIKILKKALGKRLLFI